MPYIARTDGGLTVIEIRQGSLADIAEVERANWRDVQEVRPSGRGPALTVNGDGSQVNLVWPGGSADSAWQAMELKAYAAEVRWQRASGGLTLPNGVRVDTSDASQDKITAALLILERGWVSSISFKAVSGWATLDLAAMTGIAQAVAAYVQACFAAEKECLDAIAAGAVKSRAEVDGWDWP
jgi:hypothetical protein